MMQNVDFSTQEGCNLVDFSTQERKDAWVDFSTPGRKENDSGEDYRKGSAGGNADDG